MVGIRKIMFVFVVFSSVKAFSQSHTKQQTAKENSVNVSATNTQEKINVQETSPNAISEQDFMRQKIYDKYKIKDPALIERNKKEQLEKSTPKN